MNPVYGRTVVVYIEGRFDMADNDTPLRIRIPGTDLVRISALVTPEFALSQYEDMAFPVERCTIYDAGSRSFDIPEYMHDVTDYWEQTRSLAETGFTLYNALKERWPETSWREFTTFSKKMSQIWHGTNKKTFVRLHEAYRNRWDKKFKKRSKAKEALVELCDRRLAQLKR